MWNSIKTKILLPWIILIMLIIFIIANRLLFFYEITALFNNSNEYKLALAISNELQMDHLDLYNEVLSYKKGTPDQILLEIDINKKNQSQKIGNLKAIFSNYSPLGKDLYETLIYDQYLIVNTGLYEFYLDYINAVEENNTEVQRLLPLVIEKKVKLVKAALLDIIIFSQNNEKWIFTQVKSKYQLSDIFLLCFLTVLIVGGIIFTKLQFNSLFHPISELINEMKKVEMGEYGNFKKEDLGNEINLIYIEIDNMLNAIDKSKELIKKQNIQLAKKNKELETVQLTLNKTQELALLGNWCWKYNSGILISESIKHQLNLKKSILNKKDVSELFTKHQFRILSSIIFQHIRKQTSFTINIELLSTQWVTIKGSLNTDENGKVISVCGSIQDITSWVHSERESKELAIAIEQSHDSIMITDLEGNIVFVNDSFTSSSGYRKSEVIGKNPKILQSGKTKPYVYADMWKTLLNEGTWKGVFYNQKKNGDEYIEVAEITPLRRQDGKIYRYLAVKEDITEKMKLGEDLDKYRENLERLVDERTNQLALALTKAEELGKSKQLFLANMSHEIRTPMNAILGMIYILQRSSLNNSQKRYLKQIETSGKLLLNIIGTILDFTKVEAGMMSLCNIPTKLNELLFDVKSILHQEAQDKKLQLKITNNCSISGIIVDKFRLTQILLNLINNAIKYTNKGSINVILDLINMDNNMVKIKFSIIDTGTGISEKDKENLFSPFHQTQDIDRHDNIGTGLGLVVAKKIVELMNGEIGFKTELNVGSNFWFTIICPVVIDSNNITENIDDRNYEDELLEYEDLKILLADDDNTNKNVILGLLQNNNAIIDAVENGEEAINLLNTNSYDLVLMDVQMPVLDGLSATKQIRKTNPFIPIIAISANTFDDDRSKCFEAGMNDFIPKPFKPEELFKCICLWTEKYRKYNEYINLNNVMSLFRNNINNYFTITDDFFKRYQDIKTDEMSDEYIHKLKGAAGTLGFDLIMNKCIECRNDINNIKSKTDIITFLTESKNIINKVRGLIKPVKNNDEEPLQKLYSYLTSYDSRSVAYLNDHNKQFEQIIGSEYSSLMEEVTRLNFKNAINICNKYMINR